MIIAGLTGSIGMGKTTAANMLRAMDIPVHCADEAVHDLLGKNDAAIEAVAALCPESYDDINKCIDRKILRDSLGQDTKKWDALEAVLHPLVQQAQQKFIDLHRTKNAKVIVLDIPLLFETGAEKRLDQTICVTAAAAVQKQRVLNRPGMSEDYFDFLLSRQMPDEEKCKKSDFIVPSDKGEEHTRNDLKQIIAALEKQEQKNESRHIPPHHSR